MLFILTGDVQIGKTRWLERTIGDLEAAGVPCAGVIAPGVWRDHGAEAPDGARFEKLGISNVLLPGRECVPFAQRRDLAQASGAFDAGSQSARAQLGWEISDEAIARVNAHFARIAERVRADEAEHCEPREAPPGLLVVDELGRLELQCDGGLTEAVRLLERGPSAAFPHALAVVRQWAVPLAEERFEQVWGPLRPLGPGDDLRRELFEAFGKGPRA